MKTSFNKDKYLSIFRDEAKSQINKINNLLIELEKDFENKEIIREIKREVHTIKGSSRMMGMIDISNLFHSIEDVFIKIENKQIQIENTKIFNIIFNALDVIRQLLDNKKDVDVEKTIDILALKVKLKEEDVKGKEPVKESIKTKKGIKKIKKEIQGTKKRKKAEKKLIKILGDKKEEKEEDKEGKIPGDIQKRKIETNFLRVALKKINNIISITGEINVANSLLERNSYDADEILDFFNRNHKILQQLETEQETKNIKANKEINLLENFINDFSKLNKNYLDYYSDFKNSVNKMTKVVKELIQDTMNLRLIPLSHIFDLYPRLVRDLSVQFNKEVIFIVKGQEIEIDKEILEKIKDPIMHIIRNSITHGIETIKERKEKKKSLKGKLELKASQLGEFIMIEVSDDGAGINTGKLKKEAIQKGILFKEQNVKDESLLSLIFKPDFSTSDAVTDISGRGIGLDVVKKNIEEIHGEIIVDSEVNKGTKFILKLPLTLSIIHVLLVIIAGQTFGMPVFQIEDIIIIKKKELKSIKGKPAFIYKEQCIIIKPLDELMQIGKDAISNEELAVVVIHYNKETVGFVVDKVLMEKSIVVNKIEGAVNKNKILTGTAVLSGGAPILILNPLELMNLSQSDIMYVSEEKVLKEEPSDEKQTKVLVVEDSLIVRELEKSILLSNGFLVETAQNGEIAYQKLLDNNNYDVIITDIEMPVMDGFELAEKIKTNKDFQNIPIIMITSHNRQDYKERAFKMGIHAYVNKNYFEGDKLIEMLKKL